MFIRRIVAAEVLAAGVTFLLPQQVGEGASADPAVGGGAAARVAAGMDWAGTS